MMKILEIHVTLDRFGFGGAVERVQVLVSPEVTIGYRAGGAAYDACCKYGVHVDNVKVFCEGREVNFELPVMESC